MAGHLEQQGLLGQCRAEFRRPIPATPHSSAVFFFFFRALSGSGQERKQQSGVTPASLSSVLKLGVLRA